MINYLVIDDGRNSELEYINKWMLFTTPELAVSHAKSIGYDDSLSFGINLSPGFANRYVCGDVDITIVAIKVEHV